MPSPAQSDRELLVTQTAGYRPTLAGVLPGFAGASGFAGMGGLFSLSLCDQMARDDAVALGLKYLQTPVFNAKVEVESEDAAEQKWAEEQIDRFWHGTGLAVAMRDDVYGRRPAEMVCTRRDGLWHFGRLEPLHPRDVQPYTCQGQLVYLQVSGATTMPVVEAHHPDVERVRAPDGRDDDAGCWKLRAATVDRPAKGCWWVNDPTISKWYGVLTLEPCWWAWRAKTQPDAMLEALLKWVYKWGVTPSVIRHPDLVYEEEGQEPVPGGDYARRILEELKAAGIVALSSARDKNGNYLWAIESWSQIQGVAANLIEPIEFLNKMMLRSLGIPDEVLQFTGEGSQARAKVSTAAFYLSRQMYAGVKLEQFDAQILRPMARKNNFRANYRLKLTPFLEDPSLMGGSQGAVPGQPPGGGKAPGGDDPLAALFGSLPGGGPDAEGGDNDGNGQPPKKPSQGVPMALGARRSAAGRSPAVSFYDALCEELRARRAGIDLAWVRTPGVRSQNRWIDTETQRVRYQAEEPGSVKKRIAGAQGAVDAGRLRQAMERHRTTQPLSERQQAHAAQAWQMLKAHHGANALHRVKELVEADLRGLAEGRTYHRNGAALLDRLQGWRHVLEQAQAEGRPLPAAGAAATAPAVADAPWEGKGEVVHGRVYNAPVGTLHVDPAQFQYKVSGIGSEGVTDEMKQVKVWNPDFAGVVSVWQDPATGKTMVVNGHHRHELARRLGVKELAVRYVNAKDAKEARAAGALINIAEGRGTALDAAKFMRDTGTGVEDFQKHGVSLKGKVAQSAALLTGLSDRAFRALAEGGLDEGKALAVARHLKDHDLQDVLFGRLKQREDEGKDYSPRVVEEMARALALTPQASQEGGLFDLGQVPLIEERAEVAAHVRAELAREASAWKAVASEQKAKRVTGEGKGNVLDVEHNKAVAQDADRAQNVYDQLVNVKGPIADAVGEAALALSQAKTRKDRDHAKQRAVQAVRDAIQREQEGAGGGAGAVREADRGAEGAAVRGSEAAPGGGPAAEGAPDAGRGDPGPPAVAPPDAAVEDGAEKPPPPPDPDRPAPAPAPGLPEHEAVAALKGLGLRHADAVHVARAAAGRDKEAVLAAGRAKLAETPAPKPAEQPRPAPAQAPAPLPPGGKLSWQQTAQEWAAAHPGREAAHRARVERAVAEGLPVPDEVRRSLGPAEAGGGAAARKARFLQAKGYASARDVPPGERAALQAEWQATPEYARLKSGGAGP